MRERKNHLTKLAQKMFFSLSLKLVITECMMEICRHWFIPSKWKQLPDCIPRSAFVCVLCVLLLLPYFVRVCPWSHCLLVVVPFWNKRFDFFPLDDFFLFFIFLAFVMFVFDLFRKNGNKNCRNRGENTPPTCRINRKKICLRYFFRSFPTFLVCHTIICFRRCHEISQ